jgi:Type II CAAX prenyl endopeptidase Rce1-like
MGAILPAPPGIGQFLSERFDEAHHTRRKVRPVFGRQLVNRLERARQIGRHHFGPENSAEDTSHRDPVLEKGIDSLWNQCLLMARNCIRRVDAVFSTSDENLIHTHGATLVVFYITFEELIFRMVVLQTLVQLGPGLSLIISVVLFASIQVFHTPGWRPAIFPEGGALVIGLVNGTMFIAVCTVTPLVLAHTAFFFASLMSIRHLRNFADRQLAGMKIKESRGKQHHVGTGFRATQPKFHGRGG